MKQRNHHCGTFIGTVEAEWLEDGETMQLTREFGYLDPGGTLCTVPAGTVVNGASIPRVFWRLIGAPLTGKYRDASVVHDYQCVSRREPSWLVHNRFYWAMRCGGVGPVKAWLMWAAVRAFGPRW